MSPKPHFLLPQMKWPPKALGGPWLPSTRPRWRHQAPTATGWLEKCKFLVVCGPLHAHLGWKLEFWASPWWPGLCFKSQQIRTPGTRPKVAPNLLRLRHQAPRCRQMVGGCIFWCFLPVFLWGPEFWARQPSMCFKSGPTSTPKCPQMVHSLLRLPCHAARAVKC